MQTFKEMGSVCEYFGALGNFVIMPTEQPSTQRIHALCQNDIYDSLVFM